MHIVDYNILRAGSEDRLIEQVMQAIAEGWQPIGGFVTCAPFLAQTMVKYQQIKMHVHGGLGGSGRQSHTGTGGDGGNT